MPQPELPKTFGTFGAIPEMRVPETPESAEPALLLPVNGLMNPNCLSAE